MMNSKRRPIPDRRTLGVTGGFVALVLAGAIFYRASGTDVVTSAATVQMTDSLQFQPATVRIQVGETITWRNGSQVPHSVTADPGLAANRSNVRLPSGASAFNAANVAPGRSYSHTFSVPGEYRYFCIPHEAQGMVGTIVVTR
jgi:plastocyanin